jgi:uncharacterized protein with HEPN domain
MSQDALAADELVTDAVLRNIEIIGEATKNLPDDARAKAPGIEWKKIAGMRDWLSHIYHRVDPDIVWDVVATKIPELLRAIQGFQGEGQPGGAAADLHVALPDHLGAEGDSSLDVGLPETGVVGQDLGDGPSAREEVEDRRDPDAMASDARPPEADVEVDRDA